LLEEVWRLLLAEAIDIEGHGAGEPVEVRDTYFFSL